MASRMMKYLKQQGSVDIQYQVYTGPKLIDAIETRRVIIPFNSHALPPLLAMIECRPAVEDMGNILGSMGSPSVLDVSSTAWLCYW